MASAHTHSPLLGGLDALPAHDREGSGACRECSIAHALGRRVVAVECATNRRTTAAETMCSSLAFRASRLMYRIAVADLPRFGHRRSRRTGRHDGDTHMHDDTRERGVVRTTPSRVRTRDTILTQSPFSGAADATDDARSERAATGGSGDVDRERTGNAASCPAICAARRAWRSSRVRSVAARSSARKGGTVSYGCVASVAPGRSRFRSCGGSRHARSSTMRGKRRCDEGGGHGSSVPPVPSRSSK